MKTIDEKIAVMQAYKDGKTIEFTLYGNNWCDAYNPSWNWRECDYRVKPEPECKPDEANSDKILKNFKMEWIPVTERLPEKEEYVGNVAKYYLVQNEYGDMLVARYTHNGCWEQIYQLKPCDDEIVAWMPLPEKFKKGE